MENDNGSPRLSLALTPAGHLLLVEGDGSEPTLEADEARRLAPGFEQGSGPGLFESRRTRSR